jgi:simple sugar transport system permease protein
MRSVTGIINAATLTSTIAIGVTMLMISGEFDLSVGSLLAVGGYVFGTLATMGHPVLGLFLGLLVPGLLGAVNGLILIWTGVPSFLVTLGTKYFYRGMLWVISGGAMLQTVEKLPIYQVFNTRLDMVNDFLPGSNFRSSLLWLLILVGIFQFILIRTSYGNHVFATGGNSGAALGQVNVRRVKVINSIISGALAGFTGILKQTSFDSTGLLPEMGWN